MSENVDQPVPVVKAIPPILENLLFVGQLCPLSATRRLSSSSETLRSRSSQSQQPILSLHEPEFCEPEFCEHFGYEPTFFGSQKFGSQKMCNFCMVHIFPKFTNFRWTSEPWFTNHPSANEYNKIYDVKNFYLNLPVNKVYWWNYYCWTFSEEERIIISVMGYHR